MGKTAKFTYECRLCGKVFEVGSTSEENAQYFINYAVFGEDLPENIKGEPPKLHGTHICSNGKGMGVSDLMGFVLEGAGGIKKEDMITKLEKEGMQSAAKQKQKVIKLMKKLKNEGGTFKEIANFLNVKKVPTFSGRGKWHAQSIHRLCGDA